MNSHPTPLYHKAFILLAPAFDESFAVSCLCQMRDNGLAAVSVGLSSGLLSGQRGLTMRPDLSLTQFERLQLQTPTFLLVVPGGSSCVNALLADPRVHRLIRAALNQNNDVAVAAAAYPLLANAGLLESGDTTHVLAQEGLDAAAFIQRLIERMM